MAWTYGDWNVDAVCPTTAAKLTRLRLHQAEVAAQISANVARDGASRQVDPLTTYYDRLVDREGVLLKRPDAVAGGTISRARMV